MRHRKTVCAVCGGCASEVGRISRSGLCRTCGWQRQVENTDQLINRSGPFYEAWLEGTRDFAEARQARVSG